MVGLKERGRVGRHYWGKVMVKLCYFRVGGWGSVKCCGLRLKWAIYFGCETKGLYLILYGLREDLDH
jgi:hypothetical protein